MNSFPTEGPNRIVLPSLLGTGGVRIESWQVTPERIEFAPAPVAVPTDDDYKPIFACVTQPTGVQTGGSQVSMDTAISRISIYFDEISVVANATVPQVLVQVRGAVRCIPELLFTGTLDAKTKTARGLVVQVSGWMVEQFELWALCANGTTTCSMRFHVLIDRRATTTQITKGSLML